ncbi:hypothetical protein RRG08_013586 [Elysia crispata]|uniref:Uncharacterized protein n=1 Tax=Elysia crispata TaxID=231223 RepID=A0AAE1CR76_9GAST|nr:hypothetical protein RRG08_013586 [Elysia crispata]
MGKSQESHPSNTQQGYSDKRLGIHSGSKKSHIKKAREAVKGAVSAVLPGAAQCQEDRLGHGTGWEHLFARTCCANLDLCFLPHGLMSRLTEKTVGEIG